MQAARAALLSLTLLLGCKDDAGSPAADTGKSTTTASTSGGIDMAKLERDMGLAMKTAMAKPTVTAAMNKAWEDIAADPAVSSSGQAVLAAIGEHEKFTPVAAEFMAKMQTSASFVKVVTDFVTSSGITDPTQIEAAFGRYVDAQIARPAVNDAIEASIGRVMTKPEIEAAIAAFVNVLMTESGVAQELTSMMENKLSSPGVIDALNKKAGTSPSDPDYEQKIFAYITQEDRLERFLIGFAELFGKHEATRKAVVDLLRSPAMVDVSATMIAQMMSTPDFYPLAEAALVAALDPSSDQALVESKLDPIMNHPQIVEAMAGWFTGIMAVPELRDGCSAAFKQLFGDPQFEQLLVKTFAE